MLKFLIFVTFLTFANCKLRRFDEYYGSNLLESFEDSDGNGDAKIVGGETSPIHYPYQLSLQMKKKEESGGGGSFMDMFSQKPNSNYSHFCGASIVNENYFVTAAHCIEGFNQSRMSVLAGVNDLREEDKGSRHFVESCIIHPEYAELNHSDISLCRVENSFVFGENIAPVVLSTDYVGGQVDCTLTGWGSTRMLPFIEKIPNELQRATVPTLTTEQCNEKNRNVGRKNVCTLSKFRQGACRGDSGGPLAKDGVLVGIVSYGSMICASNSPDVFTRVSEFVEWIQQNSGANK